MRRLVDDRWEDTEELSDGDGEEEMDQTEPAKKFRRPGRYYRNQVSGDATSGITKGRPIDKSV